MPDPAPTPNPVPNLKPKRNRAKAIKDIVARHREIQFAADAAWAHTNQANAGIL